jgi:hypothetical protein
LKYQVCDLRLGELEHEVRRKALHVSPHRQIERPGLDAVERRKVCVEHHAFATDDVDPRFDPGGDRLGRHTDVIGLPLLG